MDYYRILNLTREPFSNSPDPELFYRTRQHLECLQQLEIAVRLKRGLNVVIGEVGTGKTTLCRQFLRQMADDATSSAHLILDPDFSNSREFLEALRTHFAGEEQPGDESEWKLKEWIKSHLFEQAVDKGRTVVLVIDEGQKIPPHCLEILRELLNYESNNFKLLQIVIFAQQEFSQVMASMPNFADRINYFFELGPMSFWDTVRMIRYRLEQSRDLEKPPVRFSPAAYLALYRATRGYPRKVINLCHQLLLGLIVQNKSLITWPMVQSTISRMRPAKHPWLKWAMAALVLFVVAGGVAAYKWPLGEQKSPTSYKGEVAKTKKQSRTMPKTSKLVEKTEVQEALTVTASLEPTRKVVEDAAPEKPDPREAAPAREAPQPPGGILGSVVVEDQHTLWQLARDVYGVKDHTVIRRMIARIVQENPELSDPDVLMPGMVLSFPIVTGLDNALPSGIWLAFDTTADLQTAVTGLDRVRTMLEASFSDASVRLADMPRAAGGKGRYSILLAQRFESPAAASIWQADLQREAGLHTEIMEIK